MAETSIQAAPRPADIFSEKVGAVTVQEVSSTASPAPSLHVRRHEHSAKRRSALKQKPIDRFFKTCARQSAFVKAFVLTLISSIPFVVFLLVTIFAVPATKTVDTKTKVKTREVSEWLIISWATFMGLLWCGRIFAAFATWLCNQSQALVKYQRIAEALCLRVVLMVWAIICFFVMPSLFSADLKSYDPTKKNAPKAWPTTLQKTFMFLIIAFALIVAQGIILEYSAMLYIQGWMGPRSQRASDELATIKQLQDLVDPHTDDQVRLMGKLIKKLLKPINEDDLYYQVSNGFGDAQVWREYAHSIWDSISQGKQSITRLDITEQLRVMNRDPDRGHELFTQLDESCDGEVTEDEVEKLVRRVGLQLNARNEAQHGIDGLMRKLEVILSIVMLVIIFIVWLQFFDKTLASKVYTYWTGVTALSFAFAGVVTEFISSCVFVFGKHPYDVGDYVELKGKKLIVQKIFITHTNFEEVTDPTERGTVIQASHSSLFGELIINWTRTLEAVIQKKDRVAHDDGVVADAKTAAENKATDDARELVALQVEQLKGINIKHEEKY